MMKKLLQAAHFLLLVVAISAQAPGDHDPECRTDMNEENHIFPENWKVLLDTYDYQNIFDPSGSGDPVWKQEDFDGDDEGWSQIVGGACTWSLYTCTFIFGTQNNWLFSQYISYGDAQEVFFNVSFRFTSCRDVNVCSDDFVTVYRYDVDGPVSDAARTDPDNYTPLKGTVESSRLKQKPSPARDVMRTLSMPRPEPTTNGFYLAMKDSGTCGEVNRLITYYTVCHERQKELVLYPEVGTPPQAGEDQVFSAKCVENAHNVTSLQVTAFSGNGTCQDLAEGGARCNCNAGYQISDNRDSCEECPAGKYRFPGLSSTCQDCPANTEVGAVAASNCSCLPGFFRTAQEGPNVRCTVPPSAATSLTVDLQAATSDSITVSWKPPNEKGRNDFYYEVLVAEMATQEVVHVEEVTTTENPVVYTVEGLRSFTNYTVTVITHNGVSDQDTINQAQRLVQVRAATSEGVPGAPQVTTLCTVVIWKAPTNPSGLIVSYEARFGQSDEMIVKVNADTNFIITEDEYRSNDVVVEMRAINSFATGPWSAPSPLNCTSQTMSCPGNTMTTPATSCPAAPADGTVTIEVEYECNEGFVLVGDATRSCQDDGSLEGSAPSCIPECQTELPHFTLNGVQVANESVLNILSIGTQDSALLAETPYDDCCREARIGECFYPNGTQVGIPNAGEPFFRNRGEGFIRLNRRSGVPTEDYPLGTYRCDVPNGCGTFVPLYVELE